MRGRRRPWRRDSGGGGSGVGLDPHTSDPLTHGMITQAGGCRPGICGEEAACKNTQNFTHICICPYDSSPPTMDLKCPNRAIVKAGPQAGECVPGICGEEAACKRFPNSTHMCLCPHDSTPPTADLKCPNRLTVPLTPRPIHNIIPPSGSNSTASVNISTSTEMANKSLTPISGSELAIMSGGLVVCLLLVLLMASVCWWKRKILTGFLKNNTKNKNEIPLTTEPLLAERYISNPQYSNNSSPPNAAPRVPTVPVLRREALTFKEEIGEGCYGKVYRGEILYDNNVVKTVAIKVLKDSAGRTAEDDFNREVNIMSAFRHVNILTLMGVVQKAENGYNPWMVFEFMPFGDLAGVLRSNSPAMRQNIPDLPPLDSKLLLSIALQIARGMRYLAAQRFVHRDLACRNCLVGQGLVVKIADFGMSRDVYTCDYYKMGGNRPMPIRWMSPESILYARFTLESDVWSYGVVLWEIYSLGKQPFYGHNNEGASKMILQGIMLIPPENCPAIVCELMRTCWKTDPKDRVQFQDICDKLQAVQEGGSWEGSGSTDSEGGARVLETRVHIHGSMGRASLTGTMGRLPRPPATLPVPPPCPPSPQSQADLTDPEGYLLPAQPAVISEYITALPN